MTVSEMSCIDDRTDMYEMLVKCWFLDTAIDSSNPDSIDMLCP